MKSTIEISRFRILAFVIFMMSIHSCTSQDNNKRSAKNTSPTTTNLQTMQHNDDTVPEEYTQHLTKQQYNVLVNKATDRPGNDGYTDYFEEGVYHCRACGSALYKSTTKFHSGCGWPSFDAEIPGSVKRIEDMSMGMKRVEIVCKNCNGHLGHVFEGERFTSTNTRHCVNTSSLTFHPAKKQVFYLSNGDFRPSQYALQQVEGVLYTETGFANALKNSQPVSQNSSISLDEVTSKSIQALEVVKVEYDPSTTTIETILQSYLSLLPNIHSESTTSPYARPVILFDQKSINQQPTPIDGFSQTTLSSFHKAPAELQNTERKNRAKK